MTRFWIILLISVVAVGMAGMIVGGAAPAELSTIKADRQETSFGDLTADALCRAPNTTIALVAAVSFKPGTIPAANPTQQQITSLLQTPDETWAVSKLTGAKIQAALERSLSRVPLPNMAFFQVSGLKVYYNPEAPRGRRITSIRTSKGPLQTAQEYQVVMPLFLAKGGSGYLLIFNKDHIVRQGTSGLATVIKSYADAKGQLNYTGQGRIIVARQ